MRKKKIKGECSVAGRSLKKHKNKLAGKILAECRWNKPNAKKKASAKIKAIARAKKLRKRMSKRG